MEALYFFKFWKPNPSQKGEDVQLFSTQNTGPSTMSSKNIKPGGGDQQEDEEGEDAFFELKLITATSLIESSKNPITTSTDLKHSSTNTCTNNSTPARDLITRGSPMESYSYRFEFDPNNHSFTSSKPKKAGPFLEPSSDSISKRKILPIEPGSKPQSPISLLKSAPSLKVLTFKKSKSMARRDLLEDAQGSLECTVRVKEISSCSPVLGRDNSLRRYIREDPLTRGNDDEEWKLGKYLKFIYRPLNARKEKKATTRAFSTGEQPARMGSPSPSCSPLTVESSPRKDRTGSGRIRVACKKLGKSKSSSVAVAAPAPAGRRDDSLALHHDGIQGAILHCKKSFNSSRDPSFLSRFACEALQEYSQCKESPRSSSELN